MRVVADVRHGELVGHAARHCLLPRVGMRRLRRHQPPVDGDGQVLQEAVVLGQLRLQGLESDAAGVVRGNAYGCRAHAHGHALMLVRHLPSQGGGVLEEGMGELVDLALVEPHAVLVHTGAHDVLQLLLLDEAVAC